VGDSTFIGDSQLSQREVMLFAKFVTNSVNLVSTISSNGVLSLKPVELINNQADSEV
jgi:hypothetical protein